jgi:hypothetical protein
MYFVFVDYDLWKKYVPQPVSVTIDIQNIFPAKKYSIIVDCKHQNIQKTSTMIKYKPAKFFQTGKIF